MPIKSHKLGPGTLTLGAANLQVNAQLTACRLTPSENVESTDDIKVLSGEKLEGEDTVDYTYVLAGNLLQDLDAAGVVDFSWDNKGLTVAFNFTPNTAAAASVSGQLRMIPISIGGDEVEARMQSDFSWNVIGDPVWTPGA